jgi:FMN phosphatase YigB (HAD superfamily)
VASGVDKIPQKGTLPCNKQHVTIHAVIFDVYGTILEVAPGPSDAEERWVSLWHDLLAASPRLSLAAFSTACARVIARESSAAKSLGVPWPEIYWPDIVGEVLPEFGRFREPDRAEFLYRQAQIWHTVRRMPGAAEALRKVSDAGLLLGIASNAQPYAPREVERELAPVGLSLALFHRSLCFWSFEHGFSKPDPHVFRLLAMRLAALGVPPSQTSMVGDHLDNDVLPARAQGWRTWQVTTLPVQPGNSSGDWLQVLRCLGLR